MDIGSLIIFIVSFAIKAFIYVTYFIPLILARALQYFDLWPTLWPFSPLI